MDSLWCLKIVKNCHQFRKIFFISDFDGDIIISEKRFSSWTLMEISLFLRNVFHLRVWRCFHHFSETFFISDFDAESLSQSVSKLLTHSKTFQDTALKQLYLENKTSNFESQNFAHGFIYGFVHGLPHEVKLTTINNQLKNWFVQPLIVM